MRRRLVTPLLLVPLLVTGLAACSNPTAEPATPAATDSGYEWDVAYATCMRAAGHDFADPDPEPKAPNKTHVDDEEKFQADGEACTKSVTHERGERPVSEEERTKRKDSDEMYAGLADCLRKLGYSVELGDGVMTPEEGIPDAEFQKCAADSGVQMMGGGE